MLFNTNNILERRSTTSILVIEKIGPENIKIFFSNRSWWLDRSPDSSESRKGHIYIHLPPFPSLFANTFEPEAFFWRSLETSIFQN